jgi:hypothetical protein
MFSRELPDIESAVRNCDVSGKFGLVQLSFDASAVHTASHPRLDVPDDIHVVQIDDAAR